VRAGIETASLLEHQFVEPVHPLLGCPQVPGSPAARVFEADLAPSAMGIMGEATERTRMDEPPPAHQATGIFAETTRRVVAEGALRYASRHGVPRIGTGHLLLATLDAREGMIDRIVGDGVIGSGPVLDGWGPRCSALFLETSSPRPGCASRRSRSTCRSGSSPTNTANGCRADGGSTATPTRAGFASESRDSRSEEDVRIDVDGIVASAQPARQRLLDVTPAALASLQEAVVRNDAYQLARRDGDRPVPQPHAEIDGDDANPTLRLGCGSAQAPALVLTPPLLLNSVLHG
jgi:hypothetical protein